MCFDIGFITCGPNEAMVISGVFHSPPTIITGGRALVCPCAQIVQRIPLSTMTLIVQSPKVYTMQGVPINVTGVAQVKINSQHEEMMRAAAEQFGDMSEQEIEHGKNFWGKTAKYFFEGRSASSTLTNVTFFSCHSGHVHIIWVTCPPFISLGIDENFSSKLIENKIESRLILFLYK